MTYDLQWNSQNQKDFFISCHSADLPWAEWVAWQLEQEGYTIVIQAWDIQSKPGFVQKMKKAIEEAGRIIAILSPDYLKAQFTQAEWTAAFKFDPTGEQGLLLPIHVRECRYELAELSASIIFVDLVGQEETKARVKLLASVHRIPHKPTISPEVLSRIQSALTVQPRFPGVLPDIWNLPKRNPFFAGREDILNRLHEAYNKTGILVQPQALSGLGGIGKTQIAIEYAYRYHSNYQAVLWVNADSHKSLQSDFVKIANKLNPSKNEQNPSHAVTDVKRWLEVNSHWLLILDNANDLAIATEYMPLVSTGKNHILLTTCAQAMGKIAQRIEVDKMKSEEGALFLLRRAHIAPPDASLKTIPETNYFKAKVITEAMDGLPLGLDQAGAYIEETGCGLLRCMDICRTQRERAKLLKRLSKLAPDHPESVAMTWIHPFNYIKDTNPAAAELLRFCAFLHPDMIPEEIFIKGGLELGPILQLVATDSFELDATIEELLKFSFVKRDPETKTLTIHRLVQAVLKDGMDEIIQREWAVRTVRAVNCACPSIESAPWQQYQQYLPHTQVCASLITEWKIEATEVDQRIM